MRVAAGLAATLAAVVLSACGGGGGTQTTGASSRAVDDEYLARVFDHQQQGLRIAQAGAAGADQQSVRAFARSLERQRRRAIAVLAPRRAEIRRPPRPGALGVAPEQAGAQLDARALKGARPFDPAFLAMAAQQLEGGLALSRAELAKGQDPEVQALARRLSTEFGRELSRLGPLLARAAASASSGSG